MHSTADGSYEGAMNTVPMLEQYLPTKMKKDRIIPYYTSLLTRIFYFIETAGWVDEFKLKFNTLAVYYMQESLEDVHISLNSSHVHEDKKQDGNCALVEATYELTGKEESLVAGLQKPFPVKNSNTAQMPYLWKALLTSKIGASQELIC